jgi:16S rRNA C1402 (ribose-2'-O) methylase RsmI
VHLAYREHQVGQVQQAALDQQDSPEQLASKEKLDLQVFSVTQVRQVSQVTLVQAADPGRLVQLVEQAFRAPLAVQVIPGFLVSRVLPVVLERQELADLRV